MDIAATLSNLWDMLNSVDLMDLVERHGAWFYFVTFVWTFLEGETFVIFAGAAAAQDALDIRLLVFVAWVGSFCGDQTYFYLGRKFGPALLRNFPKLLPGATRVANLILKYDIAFILTYRFIYGLRNISSVAMGLSGLPWKKFAFWNCIAAFIWACVFAGAGYWFGEVMDRTIGSTAEHAMLILLIAVIVIFTIKFTLKRIKKRRKLRKQAIAAALAATMPPDAQLDNPTRKI